ncbi:MAG TPA: MauE/DoxX family redox-associated membrane protein [Propionicimonas sp.]|nr:MauE/DoxX family redox-associated membrane protein [Propionicimonas sp.]HRA05554.1 MauE/DoxX family redox-associated membrane protein [Propionicimonas sp.]
MTQAPAVPGFRRPWTEWVTLAARLVLGIVLLVAGLLKVGHLDASVQSVRLYQLLPWETTAFVGSALPIIEIATGVLLITGTFVRVSAIIGSLLMLAFIIGIASVWARGISIDCGCFSPGGEVDPSATQYPLEIARDVGLMATGVWAAWKPKSPFAVDNWLFAPLAEPDAADADLNDKELAP